MNDIEDIKEQIIKTVIDREGELLVVQGRIQAVIDTAVSDFTDRSKRLEEKYDTAHDASSTDFMNEFHLLEEEIKTETQKKLDVILREVENQAS